MRREGRGFVQTDFVWGICLESNFVLFCHRIGYLQIWVLLIRLSSKCLPLLLDPPSPLGKAKGAMFSSGEITFVCTSQAFPSRQTTFGAENFVSLPQRGRGTAAGGG